MPTVQEVVQDQEFWSLPQQEQAKVLSAIDPDFSGLPGQEQQRALQALRPSQALEDTGVGLAPPPVGGQARTERLQAPSFTERLAEEAPRAIRPTLEAAGSLLGSALGFVAGPPGMVAGGALGFAGGRELSDIILGEQNQSIGEELVEAGENVLEGAKLEAMGAFGAQILTRTGARIFKPAAKKVSTRIAERLKAAQRLDTPVTLGEATESVTLKKGENFLRKLITPAGQFQRFDQVRFDKLLQARFDLINDVTRGIKRKESAEALGIEIKKEVDSLLTGKIQARGRVLDKARNEILEIFGSPETYEELGRTLKEAVEGRQRELETAASSFFDAAKKALPLAGEEAVDTTSILRAVNAAIEEESKLLPAVRNKRILGALFELKTNLELVPERVARAGFAPGGVAALPSGVVKKPISFNSLVKTRSGLNDVIRGLETQVGLPGEQQLIISGKKASRQFKAIKNALDDDLARFAKESGTDVDKLVQSGVNVSRQKFEFVKNPGIKRLIKSEPEKIVDVILRPKQVSLIKSLRSELKEPGIEPLRKAAANKVLGVGIDEPISSIAINKRIRAAGEDTLRELMGESDFLSLKDFSKGLMAQERSIARLGTTGIVPKGLGLGEIDLAGNKFYRNLIRTQKPQNLIDIVYQPGNTRNVKRTYAGLRAMGKPEKIQDLKAAWLESILEIDPNTGNLVPENLVKNLNKLDDATLKVALSPEELSSFRDIAKTSLLIEPKIGKGAGLEVIRFIAEPVGKPLAWAYLKADGRNLLKKALKEQIKGVSLAQRRATMIKLITIGKRAAAESEIRDIEGREGLGPFPLIPQQELETTPVTR